MKTKILKLTEFSTVLLIFAGFFISCNNKLEKPAEVEANVVTKIEAKVENASKYSNIAEVKLMLGNIELARGDWKNGGFTIVLPKTVDPNNLHALMNNNQEYMTIINPPSTVKISNKTVKVGNVAFWGVDKEGNMVTRFYSLEIDEDGNGQDAYYTYVDSDVSTFGYTERINSTLAFTEYDNARYIGINLILNSFDKITTTYSVKWEKGWNVWSFSRFANIPENTATEKWSPARSLKWYGTEDMRVRPKEE